MERNPEESSFVLAENGYVDETAAWFCRDFRREHAVTVAMPNYGTQ